jgi:hypothetical protein
VKAIQNLYLATRRQGNEKAEISFSENMYYRNFKVSF